jgi:cytidine deaminase
MENADLINKAASLIHGNAGRSSEIGEVGCALVSASDRIFYGVCIDLHTGMGLCAEHAAVAQMVTHGESKIRKIVTVWKDSGGRVFVVPPCGRCREFMRQINPENLNCTEVVLDRDKSVMLAELLPYHDWWKKQE